MSRNVLTNLNLNKNELQNAVIQPLAAAPQNPKFGQIYTNSQDKVIYQFDGDKWKPVGVVYNQAGSTGAVIVGLDDAGNVTTKKVTELTLTDYTPVDGGYVAAGTTIQQAISALDTAVKNAVAGGAKSTRMRSRISPFRSRARTMRRRSRVRLRRRRSRQAARQTPSRSHPATNGCM